MHRLSKFLENWHRTLLLVFLAGLATRLALVAFLQDGFYFPDSISYTRAAGYLLAGNGWGPTYERAPAYPVFLAVVQSVFGNSILAIRVTESLLGALLAVIVAVLGNRIGGPAVGALAGVLWSLYPMGVFIVMLVYPTALMAILLATATFFILPGKEQPISSSRVFVGGLFLGAGALTVPVGLATIGLITLWIIYWGGPKRFVLAGVLLIGTAVTLVPWTVRNYYVHDRLVLVDARMEDHLPRMSAGSDSPRPKSKREGKIEEILRNPGPFLARSARQFVRFWRIYPERLGMDSERVRERYHKRDPRVIRSSIFSTSDLKTVVSVATTVPLFVFALIGAAALWWNGGDRRYPSYLCTIILSFAIGYSFFFAKIRFRVPIEPFLVILAAYGVVQTCAMLFRRTFSRASFQTQSTTAI